MSDSTTSYRGNDRPPEPRAALPMPFQLPSTAQSSSQLHSTRTIHGSSKQDHAEQCQQEAIRPEDKNRELEIRLNELEIELASEFDVSATLEGEDKECAQLEYQAALLEAELEGGAIDESLLERTTLTAMEVALSQIGDTVSQLRQAQTRETAKIEQEIEQLEHDRTLLDEAQILSKALSARLAAGPPSSEELRRQSRERTAQLQEHFQTLQAGLIDVIDHIVSIHSVQSGASADVLSNNASRPTNTLPEYFSQAPRFEGDTADHRSFELKRVLETLMNEALTNEEGSSGGLPNLRQPTSTETGRALESDTRHSEQSVLSLLERTGVAEKRDGYWRLRFSV